MRDFVDWPDANDQAASRAVLSWRQYGAPKIFNTDQGSQFTSTAFTGVLVAAGIAISTDGRGRWMDNEALGYQAPMAVWRTPWLRRMLWT